MEPKRRKATPEERQEAWRLRHVEKLKLTEIAQRLNRSVSTICAWTNPEVGQREKVRKKRWQDEHPEYQSEYLRKRRGKLGSGGAKVPGAEEERDVLTLPARHRFARAAREEAGRMAVAYELFFCLETSLRAEVAGTLQQCHGKSWWGSSVPKAIRANVERNIEREIDSAVTLRSEERIDFTTFGELAEIVLANWDVFRKRFGSQKAFRKVMAELNVLRGPIAHCCSLASDEIIRLELRTRDILRLRQNS